MIADVILASLSAKELPERIPIKSVHFAFWELSKESKYSRLLSSLNFVMGPDVPLSEELEAALFRLCSSGLATVDNPNFRYLRIAAESRVAMQEVLRRSLEISESEKFKELEELSKEFQKKVCSWIKHEEKNLSLQVF